MASSTQWPRASNKVVYNKGHDEEKFLSLRQDLEDKAAAAQEFSTYEADVHLLYSKAKAAVTFNVAALHAPTSQPGSKAAALQAIAKAAFPCPKAKRYSMLLSVGELQRVSELVLLDCLPAYFFTCAPLYALCLPRP